MNTASTRIDSWRFRGNLIGLRATYRLRCGRLVVAEWFFCAMVTSCIFTSLFCRANSAYADEKTQDGSRDTSAIVGAWEVVAEWHDGKESKVFHGTFVFEKDGELTYFEPTSTEPAYKTLYQATMAKSEMQVDWSWDTQHGKAVMRGIFKEVGGALTIAGRVRVLPSLAIRPKGFDGSEGDGHVRLLLSKRKELKGRNQK